jgi:putative ABC transport system permease protein
VLRLFLAKALLLGVAGGAAGYAVGTLAAVLLGPRLAGIIVLPMPVLALWAILISVGVSLLATFLPARNASKLDPVTAFQEV